jgi:hypothetical protein
MHHSLVYVYLELLGSDAVVGVHDELVRADVVQGLELGAEEEAGRTQQLQLRLGDPTQQRV